MLSELLNFNIETSDEGFTEFFETCNKHLNYHAPCKQKYVRSNHLAFMNKSLSKEIMKRTRLRNKFLKDRDKENKSRYSKQRNYCVSLIRKMKKDYYSNLDIKKVTDNRTFWKTIKPFLSDKIVLSERITLIDNGEVVAIEQDTANVLNTFSSNIVTNLKIPEYVDYDPIANNISIPILKAILRYRNHPSIITIGEVCKKTHKFSFSFSQVGKKEYILSSLNDAIYKSYFQQLSNKQI